MILSSLRSTSARLTLYVFLALFAAFAAFVSAIDNVNTVSRIGLTANLVQHGRIDIGGYEQLTIDKAEHAGKFYSDKAPGMSFLAAPAAYAYTRALPVEGDGSHYSGLVFVATLSTSGLLTALAGAMLFASVRKSTGSLSAAAIAVAAYGLGTPTWGWATSFFGHAAAGATLMIGLLLAEQAVGGKWSARRVGIAALAGLALGAAITIEFTAAIAVTVILAYVGLRELVRSRNLVGSALSVGLIGLVVSVVQIPLLAYNAAAFGSPFSLGYSNLVGWEEMKQGLFGIGMPSIEVLGKILVGLRRGLIWLSPVLVIAALGAVHMSLNPQQRGRGLAVLGVVAFYLLMNAGYHFWDGGWSTTPRHVTPMFPFLALALGLFYAGASQPWRIATLATLGVSILVNLMIVSVDTVASEQFAAPLFQYIIPEFLKGNLKQATATMMLGINGFVALLPLLAVWAVLGWLAWRDLRKDPAAQTKLPD
jgi:hypothetical protein